MKYVYKTKGTCSTLIELELEGNIVHNVKFTGGCNGNLQQQNLLLFEKLNGIILVFLKLR